MAVGTAELSTFDRATLSVALACFVVNLAICAAGYLTGRYRVFWVFWAILSAASLGFIGAINPLSAIVALLPFLLGMVVPG